MKVVLAATTSWGMRTNAALMPFRQPIQMPKRAEAKPKQIKVNVPKTLKAA